MPEYYCTQDHHQHVRAKGVVIYLSFALFLLFSCLSLKFGSGFSTLALVTCYFFIHYAFCVLFLQNVRAIKDSKSNNVSSKITKEQRKEIYRGKLGKVGDQTLFNRKKKIYGETKMSSSAVANVGSLFSICGLPWI